MADPGSVLIVLPAWNEEGALPGVLAEIRELLPGTGVLVVNDASTDRTSQIARAAGVDVLDLPFNLGVGGAMRAGFRFARRNGYDVAVQLDADGQHDPAEVPRLLEALRTGSADVVIGARFAGRGDYQVHGPRRWAMRLMSRVLSRITGARLTDATSGFKACGPRAVALFAADYPAEYLGDTIESLVIGARAGLVVTQVGVGMRPRAAGVASHNPLKSVVFLMRAVMALLVALTRPRSYAREGAVL
ncbi:MAG TPA: glycosyltransferase family 2 protein [Candidatus Angelobacter sp.]|nr:glycosyltransferase family 2 protein [Candidatus Angelobacter sp.]